MRIIHATHHGPRFVQAAFVLASWAYVATSDGTATQAPNVGYGYFEPHAGLGRFEPNCGDGWFEPNVGGRERV